MNNEKNPYPFIDFKQEIYILKEEIIELKKRINEMKKIALVVTIVLFIFNYKLFYY